MIRISIFSTLLILAGFTALPAAADMDYRCLNACVSGGGNSSKCMSQCTYNKQALDSKHVSLMEPVRSPHDQFTPPVPSSQIISYPQGLTQAAGKDYTCSSQCLQSGHPYQFCQELCVNGSGATSSGQTTGGSAFTTPNASYLLNDNPQPASAAVR